MMIRFRREIPKNLGVFRLENSLANPALFFVEPWKSSRRCRSTSAPTENGPSYLLHPGSAPLLEQNLGQLLDQAANRFPKRDCIVSTHQNVRLTFSEVRQRADKIAAGLKKLGLNKGDRVGIWGPNTIEWYITFMAVARAGFRTVAMNPADQLTELEYGIQKVGTRAVVAADIFKTQNYPEMLLKAKARCPTLEHIVIASDKHVTGTRRFVDVEELASSIEVEAISAEQGEISPRSGAVIQFTSGTTGKPKAPEVSHRSYVNNSRECSGCEKATKNVLGLDLAHKRLKIYIQHQSTVIYDDQFLDLGLPVKVQGCMAVQSQPKAMKRLELDKEHRTVCLNVPFFHAFGIVIGQSASLHAGATVVLAGPSFNPRESINTIVKEKCTVTYGTPTMWVDLLNAQQEMNAPIHKMANGLTGGSPAAPELFKKTREIFGFENLKTIYGLSETTAVCFQSFPDTTAELAETTVGHLVDHTEAQVVDENGVPVPFGTPGELWVRGYHTMVGYYGDEENTRKTKTEDGWLKTGDQFILRSNGHGRIIGRIKDMLIRGGENIFPKEIEDFLATHPAVMEAHVFGVHDDRLGEDVCACIRLRKGFDLTERDVKEYGKGRIAHFKIPRYVHFTEEFPKTASGKIKKHLLREALEARGTVPTRPKFS